MPRPLRWYDTIVLSIYFLGLTTLSQTMTPLVVPLLVQRFVGEAQQGTFYGTARLWSLMVALLVQALMGMLSDRNTSRWGRRRPFIFIGTLMSLLIVVGIGFSAGMEGEFGYWFLFIMLLLLSVGSNTAHGAEQGLIPDLVPENQRGIYSGVKALLEVPIPLILVSFTIGRLIAAGQTWTALSITMGVLVFTMLITMFAPEKPLEVKPPPIEWTPFVRLIMMTALFTAIILGMGEIVKWVGTIIVGLPDQILLLVMGLIGFLSMGVAIAFGVYFSVRLSVGGEAARKYPSFTWWVVNRLAYLVGSTNLASFAVYFLQGRLGLPRELAAKPASQLIMFVGIFILVLVVPSGWLADRVGRKPLVIASGLIAAIGALIIVVAPNLSIIYLGGIIVGAATGLFYTANWALGTELVPKQEAGRFLGISNLAGAGAGAVGAYIGGPIADFISLHVPGQGYALLYVIYTALFLLSILAVLRVKHQPPV